MQLVLHTINNLSLFTDSDSVSPSFQLCNLAVVSDVQLTSDAHIKMVRRETQEIMRYKRKVHENKTETTERDTLCIECMFCNKHSCLLRENCLFQRYIMKPVITVSQSPQNENISAAWDSLRVWWCFSVSFNFLESSAVNFHFAGKEVNWFLKDINNFCVQLHQTCFSLRKWKVHEYWQIVNLLLTHLMGF